MSDLMLSERPLNSGSSSGTPHSHAHHNGVYYSMYVVLRVLHSATVVVPRFPPFSMPTNASGPFSKPWNRFTHGLSAPLTIILRSSALAAAVSAWPPNEKISLCQTAAKISDTWQDKTLVQRSRHPTPVADEKALHRHAVVHEQPRHPARPWSWRRGIVL